MSISVRFATEQDVPLVLAFIKKLAAYERLEDKVVATEELLRAQLFELNGAEAIFVLSDGREVGFALFYHTFSTFLGRRGVFLEDLFVEESERGNGYGRALLAFLAGIAKERGCGRLDWSVLDWNEPSIAFYKALGALPIDDWTTFRLEGAALGALADQRDSARSS